MQSCGRMPDGAVLLLRHPAATLSGSKLSDKPAALKYCGRIVPTLALVWSAPHATKTCCRGVIHGFAGAGASASGGPEATAPGPRGGRGGVVERARRYARSRALVGSGGQEASARRAGEVPY